MLIYNEVEDCDRTKGTVSELLTQALIISILLLLVRKLMMSQFEYRISNKEY